VTSQQRSPAGSDLGRSDRYRLAGGISGTIAGAIVIFVFFGFGEHPHRIGLAVIATVIFVAVSFAWNRFLYRQAKQRALSSGDAERRR
jgi:hypothetical protein